MSKLRTDLILAADGDPNTPVNIPSLDWRMAFAVVGFNSKTLSVYRSKNISSVIRNYIGGTRLNFIDKPKDATYLVNATIKANISIPWGVNVAEKNISFFLLEYADGNQRVDVPDVNVLVHGRD